MIASKTECEAAAQHLGLADTSSVSFQAAGYPYGCLYADNDYLGWYSPVGATAVSASCGLHSPAYDCICDDKGKNL